MTHDAVWRHRRAHLAKTLLKSAEAKEVLRADNLLDRLEALYQDAQEVFRAAKERPLSRRGHLDILGAMRETRVTLKVLAEIREGVQVQASVNVSASPSPEVVQAIISPSPRGRMPGEL